MTGKKVRVFWPVDSQWYIADVQQYDPNSGEHLLRYPDGDTEWVRIGEDHTTNTQYKEYFRQMNAANSYGTAEAGNLTRLPSLGAGMSFALSAAMSQSFGMPGSGGSGDDKLKSGGSSGPNHQQQRLFQQLNLDRTASSMSSFGMYGGGVGGRQPSFGPGQPPHLGKDGERLPPFQTLSPNFTHSFSSKIGTVPSLEFGPPPALPPLADGREREHPHPGYYHGGPPQDDAMRDGAPGGPHGHHSGGGWHPSGHQIQYPAYHDGGHHQQMYGYPPAPAMPNLPTSQARPSKVSSSSKKSGAKKDRKDKKAIPKAWTKVEDEYLLDQVLTMQHPLKWSIISQSMSDFNASRATADTGPLPERTGKQCRERYVNHLNPRLKHTDFTPLEDATIWRLYATIGTQWAKMSKVIPGRTDNNLKNRFHNLKRQLQRDEDSRKRATEPDDYDTLIHTDKLRGAPACLRTKIEDMWNHKHHIGLVAYNSVLESRDEKEDRNEDLDKKGNGAVEVKSEDGKTNRKFGPFVKVTEPTPCGRCSLFMPSIHCGTEICTKTRWCRACTKVSINCSGNVLREVLSLRKSQDMDLQANVDMLEAEIRI